MIKILIKFISGILITYIFSNVIYYIDTEYFLLSCILTFILLRFLIEIFLGLVEAEEELILSLG